MSCHGGVTVMIDVIKVVIESGEYFVLGLAHILDAAV